MQLKSFIAGGLLLAATALPATAQTAAGELRCMVKGAFGFVIGSNRAATCSYRRPGQPVEFYTGELGGFGLDIGPTNAVALTYKVYAVEPTAQAALQGDFAGPGFGVAAGAGVAGNVLVGGASGGATLLPVPNTATTAFTGFNVNAGLSHLTLQFAAVEQVGEPTRKRRAPRAADLQ